MEDIGLSQIGKELAFQNKLMKEETDREYKEDKASLITVEQEKDELNSLDQKQTVAEQSALHIKEDFN